MSKEESYKKQLDNMLEGIEDRATKNVKLQFTLRYDLAIELIKFVEKIRS